MNESSVPFSFPEQEESILAFWHENKIFAKSLAQTQDNESFIFYDGPPFATGLPHHGHLLASTMKDIIPRYQTMHGKHVVRRFGWDCHGLPIEYEIDKKLGMNAQQAVKKLGIAGYNQECRAIVQRYANQWRTTIERLGRWVDFDNDYKTMDTKFMESVWWVLRQLWDKDLIYKGVKVVPFSTALGTGLSNFEASSNYQDVQDPALTVLFRLEDEDAYMAAWTTTPWTLPSNLGLCVGPDIDYVKTKDSDTQQVIYFAKTRLENYQNKHNLEVLETCKGSDLAGKHYQPLFQDFINEKQRGAFQILTGDFVTTTDGTGIVHCAPAFGENDSLAFKAAGIEALVCPIDDHGYFTEEVSELAGMSLKDANKAIAQKLKQDRTLYQHDTIVHSYPFCPRSDTPLIYKAIPSWYVNVETLHEKLMANNDKIHWVPEHIQHGRFGKWLANARDWAISRNRVWGTPLPIWINDITGSAHCIGSKQELEELTGTTLDDLHREHVDHLTFEKPDEEGVYRRITEVLDCWFESGSMPYAQNHYPFENKDHFDKSFPAQFIAEGVDQTRAWFYTLHVLSSALFDKPAFLNVIVNGIVIAADGKKMSKRLRNYTPPDELMSMYGADALRLYLINSGLVKAEEQRFNDEGVKDMIRRTLLPWYNAFTFFKTYADIDQWTPKQHLQRSEHWLDRWILSRLASIKHDIANHMANYHLYLVVPALLDFIEDLTNTYIRLNRQRFWTESLDEDKCAAYRTLYTVIRDLTLMMAPFTPFLAETIFQALRILDVNAPESVHLCTYPKPSDDAIDQDLELAVSKMTQIILLGRQKRNDAKIKVKTPLPSLTIIHRDEYLLETLKVLEPVIARELNVKTVHYDSNEAEYIKLYAKPNSPVLGKRFGSNFKTIKELIEGLSAEELDAFEAEGCLTLNGEIFGSDDLLLFRESLQPDNVLTNRMITIKLDTNLTPKLIQEGLAREVVNRIQKSRKDAGLHVSDRIRLKYQSHATIAAAIEAYKANISKDTLCVSLNMEPGNPEGFKHDIDDMTLTLWIEPVLDSSK